MKPRTAFQRRITEAGNRLKPLSGTQEKWAHRKIASHFSFRTKGHINVCSECGAKFDNDSKGKSVICPECGSKLEIHDTRKRIYNENRCSAHLIPLTACRYSVSICFIPATAEGTRRNMRQWKSYAGGMTAMAIMPLKQGTEA